MGSRQNLHTLSRYKQISGWVCQPSPAHRSQTAALSFCGLVSCRHDEPCLPGLNLHLEDKNTRMSRGPAALRSQAAAKGGM